MTATMQNAGLTVLSYGAGQDSWAILIKLALDARFRATYAPGALVVVCSDTGNEHKETYDHIEFTKQFCAQHGIEFHHLTPEAGYHTETWISLESFYASHNAIGSKAFPKSCTDNLKVQPIYRWLNKWVNAHFFPESDLSLRKQALYAFTERYGKIKVLIGIAKNEEKRVANASTGSKWMTENIERVYPLLDIGLDRQGCQDLFAEHGLPCPPPSNCVFCPFKDEIEVLWTAKNYPNEFERWVELESSKLAANAHKGKDNHAVFRTRALPQVLADAEIKYAHMSIAQLAEYRNSHGHCVSSSY
jgi:3'-phosphoadenosine 5'-phosphosulfate sulfotransferase (PAPS reductase)/FAD synthetase